MKLLVCSDRLSLRGGADQHLLAVASALDADLTWAIGRDADVPAEGRRVRVRGLASSGPDERLDGLSRLAADADVVLAQNVVNPVALEQLAATGKLVVTVQDHRVFCPGPGRTLPDGALCRVPMSDAACTACLPSDSYRERLLALTRARLEALRGARRVLVLSRYMQVELEAAGIASDVVPPWVEVSRSPVAGRGFVVGGRLVAHKAPQVASEACRLAGAKLSIAGAGRLTDELEGEQLGWLANEDLRALLHASRALLFVGRWQEPFGILGVEALAEGTPVVVGASGGVEDWADAGCVRVPPGDVEATAEAIRALRDDPERALELGRRGQAMVRERFTRARWLPRLLELLVS